MKILYTSLLFLMNCVLSVAQPEVIIPKPHQLKWHEAEMGAMAFRYFPEEFAEWHTYE